jgi:hypothetical protein
MSNKILDLLIKENEAWDDLLTRQGKEIPDLEKMLSDIIREKHFQGFEFNIIVGNLKQAIQDQGSSVERIKEDLAKQQFFLEKEKKKDEHGYEINTLVSQNLLRQKIRMIEKQFLDLKSNFLNYYVNVF